MIPQRLRLLCPSKAERVIEGETFVFYVCRLGTLARFAPVLGRLTSHIVTVLKAGDERDLGGKTEEFVTKAGERQIITDTAPINPDLYERRTSKREQAIQAAVDDLFDQRNRIVLGRLLIDSLRDEFEAGQKIADSDVQEWLDSMDLLTLVEFLRGFMEANAKVFGDLGKRLGGMAEEVVGRAMTDGNPSSSPSSS